MLFGMSLDVIGITGIILLIGIVKKNGIMLVDFAPARARHEGGGSRGLLPALSSDPADDDVRSARRRPADARHRHRVGNSPAARYAIIGGILVWQLLTLFTTPVVYIYMDRLGYWVGRRRASEARALAVAREANAP